MLEIKVTKHSQDIVLYEDGNYVGIFFLSIDRNCYIFDPTGSYITKEMSTMIGNKLDELNRDK